MASKAGLAKPGLGFLAPVAQHLGGLCAELPSESTSSLCLTGGFLVFGGTQSGKDSG